jgi:endonuclease YncB( thermonuclease family)
MPPLTTVCLSRYVFDIAALKIVTVQVKTADRYGRTVGEVFLPDGANLNKQIVGAGYAWQYKKYRKDPEYAELEAAARTTRMGLWQDKSPIPPWIGVEGNVKPMSK